MSTRASIEVFFKRENYYINNDGQPDQVIPYLEHKVKQAKEEDGNWRDNFELNIRRDSDDPNMTLTTQSTGINSYEYKVKEDGTVLYKDKNKNDEWTSY